MSRELITTLEQLTKYGITEGLYLAGGTALALKYRHRTSEDLDFFTFPETDLDLQALTSKLGDSARWLHFTADTAVFIYIPTGVKVSLFNYPFPLLKDPELIRLPGIFLASDIDIACMKGLAVAQRGSKKDFYDLWFLMKKLNLDLSELLSFLQKKFPLLSKEVFLKSLVYFTDARKESYPDIDPRWQEVEDFFLRTVKDYSAGIDPPPDLDDQPST